MIDEKESKRWTVIHSSDIKLELLQLFRANPKLAYSSAMMAEQIGRPKEEIQLELDALLALRVIIKAGDPESFWLNEDEDKEIRTQMARDLLKGCGHTIRNYCERLC